MRSARGSELHFFRLIAAFSIIGFCGFPAFAQSPSDDGLPPPLLQSNLHRWGALTLFHGLPSNQVRAIASGRDGAMWFGTDAGLARYDGRRIQRFASSGPAAGRIRALALDSQGALWVGADDGAGRIVEGAFKAIPETAGKRITAIITPAPGRAILASLEGVIFDCAVQPSGNVSVRAITPDSHPLLRIDAERPLPLTSLAIRNDSLIIGTHSRGLLEIEGFLRGGSEIGASASGSRQYFVEALALGADGNLWHGAQARGDDSGLYRAVDRARSERVGFNLGTVRALAFDARAQLWAGGERGAALIVDGLIRERFTFENTAGALRSNEVYTIYADSEGVIWFGTDRGVCRYDPQSLSLEAISPDLESNFVRALYRASDGRLWSGTNRGLWVREVGGWRTVAGLEDKTVHAINEDKTGKLIVGASGGLFALDQATEEVTRLGPFTAGESIRAITAFRGALYIASYGRGLERIDAAGRALIWADAPQVVSLHAEGDRRLWIGTAKGGVFCYDGSEVAREARLDSLAESAVWAIRGEMGKGVWLATSRGLYQLTEERLSPLLAGRDVRAVEVDGGEEIAAWCVMAPGGLGRVRVDAEVGAIASRFDVELGLPSEHGFALLRESSAPGDEQLWIGTSRGLALYRPSRIAPQLRLVRALGRRLYEPAEVGAGLHLEYPQNSLALDFAAAGSRTFPEQFQYAFAVIDGPGSTLSRRLSSDAQLVLEDLRPGRYRVAARAFNIDLISSAPVEIEFEIAGAPFPWVSVTLAALLALALTAVWWGARQNRRLAGTNVALENANLQLAETRLQLANETESERRRIARDLHDQTLADLRRLMLLSDELPADAGEGRLDPATFRREIESVSTEIRRICEDLSPSVLANVGLVAALEWALSSAIAHLPAEARPEWEFRSEEGLEERLDPAPAVQIQIFRIAQEAISNVCRHARARSVRLSVEMDEGGSFILRLEDDGRGFEADQNGAIAPAAAPGTGSGGTGRGLSNIRTRASLIDARVEWSRRATGGTVFTLVKPGVTLTKSGAAKL